MRPVQGMGKYSSRDKLQRSTARDELQRITAFEANSLRD
jgi:hypothetical protein